MNCPKCGRVLKEGALFCPGCGTKVEGNAPQNQPFYQGQQPVQNQQPIQPQMGQQPYQQGYQNQQAYGQNAAQMGYANPVQGNSNAVFGKMKQVLLDAFRNPARLFRGEEAKNDTACSFLILTFQAILMGLVYLGYYKMINNYTAGLWEVLEEPFLSSYKSYFTIYIFAILLIFGINIIMALGVFLFVGKVGGQPVTFSNACYFSAVKSIANFPFAFVSLVGTMIDYRVGGFFVICSVAAGYIYLLGGASCTNKEKENSWIFGKGLAVIFAVVVSIIWFVILSKLILA